MKTYTAGAIRPAIFCFHGGVRVVVTGCSTDILQD
jgi:hypothetical protein